MDLAGIAGKVTSNFYTQQMSDMRPMDDPFIGCLYQMKLRQNFIYLIRTFHAEEAAQSKQYKITNK